MQVCVGVGMWVHPCYYKSARLQSALFCALNFFHQMTHKRGWNVSVRPVKQDKAGYLANNVDKWVVHVHQHVQGALDWTQLRTFPYLYSLYLIFSIDLKTIQMKSALEFPYLYPSSHRLIAILPGLCKLRRLFNPSCLPLWKTINKGQKIVFIESFRWACETRSWFSLLPTGF